MTSVAVDAVVAQLRARQRTLPAEVVALADAAGRWLRQDVRAPADLPGVDRCAMDGYAVRAADLDHASDAAPVTLMLVGTALAGGPPAAVDPGACVLVATGARVPEGADAVVRRERATVLSATTVAFAAPVAVGTDVRRAGEDARAGEVLARDGTCLDAGRMAGLSGAGVRAVTVAAAPRVAVQPTGDEIASGEVPDALGPGLAALLAADGAQVWVAPAVGDDVDAIAHACKRLAAEADLVVTTGGVSVGPRDLLGGAVGLVGSATALQLRLRPGHPFVWGDIDGVTVLGLPGNPGAAFAQALTIVRPVLAALQGRAVPEPSGMEAAVALQSARGRRDLIAVTRTDEGVVPVPGSGSGDLARLARLDGWADLPEDVDEVRPGEVVAVWTLG